MVAKAHVIKKIKIEIMAPNVVLIVVFPLRLKDGIDWPKLSNFFSISNKLKCLISI